MVLRLKISTSLNRILSFSPTAQPRAAKPSVFPEPKGCRRPWKLKIKTGCYKADISDIFSFLTNTHPQAGLGDTWQPEQVVKTYHYKTSIFQKYKLCSMQCFPWKTALLRAIKRWFEWMRLALVV